MNNPIVSYFTTYAAVIYHWPNVLSDVLFCHQHVISGMPNIIYPESTLSKIVSSKKAFTKYILISVVISVVEIFELVPKVRNVYYQVLCFRCFQALYGITES